MQETRVQERAPRGPRYLVRLLFGLREPVDRRTYALVGFSLMIAKYALDAAAVYAVTHAIWTPLDYLSPLLATRQQKLGAGHEGFQLAMVLWTLPFMWVGLAMTIRRAHDAGLPATAGLLFFAPVFNYVLMLLLCALPTRASEAESGAVHERTVGSRFARGLMAIMVAIGATAGVFALSVYALRSYGTGLFIGTPFVIGAISSFLYNRGDVRPAGEGLFVGVMGVLVASGGLLLFAAEGVICLLMAAPIAIAMSLLGAVIGRALAEFGTYGFGALTLPVLALVSSTTTEAWLATPDRFEVASAVEIDALREVVWRHVVSFGELPEPDWPLFRAGLAYPVRARIEGRGVGAIRRCEFSTGAFVEPITTWEEPARLAFDVIESPPPMHEWSPYRSVHPPHLDGYFRSERGEFRLIAVGGSRTRLEGSTWYELRFAPAQYWRLWSDLFVHRIHMRVLEHVKRLSEADRAG